MMTPLRHGYTTGACATAAAKAAATALRDGAAPAEVTIVLPRGEEATFVVAGSLVEAGSAECWVIKDAGDDPDITNGVEIHATISLVAGGEGAVHLDAGRGVGRVTKPGLAVAPGRPAINPVPERMIRDAVASVYPAIPAGHDLQVTISIPDGEERAKKTLNERLGIIGGLSILGTTGIVVPLSHRAWTDTIDASLSVAKAAGLARVVLSSGRTSELAAAKAFDIPEEGLVMMGDHVAHAVEATTDAGFSEAILSVQFAKLVKIASGHPQTHVANSRLDLERLAGWAAEEGYDAAACAAIAQANTAREVVDRHGVESRLVDRILHEAQRTCGIWGSVGVRVVLIDYKGSVARELLAATGR